MTLATGDLIHCIEDRLCVWKPRSVSEVSYELVLIEDVPVWSGNARHFYGPRGSLAQSQMRRSFASSFVGQLWPSRSRLHGSARHPLRGCGSRSVKWHGTGLAKCTDRADSHPGRTSRRLLTEFLRKFSLRTLLPPGHGSAPAGCIQCRSTHAVAVPVGQFVPGAACPATVGWSATVAS